MGAWAFYGRVSGVEQAANNSIPTQQEACHELAQQKGATEILDFVDAGVPGDLDWTDRPALSRLLDLVEHDRLEGVVVYDPDRLARDLGVQLAITELLLKHRVRLEFCTQEFSASPEGMLFYQLRGAIAQFERAKIRERTQRGKKKALRLGRPINNAIPYGLRYHRSTNTWSIAEPEAETVRQVFAMRAAGAGPVAIANHLNANGVKAPRCDRWWHRTVSGMLANPAYAGHLRLHRWNAEGVHKNRFLSKDRRVRPSLRPAAEWVEVAVPAIVTGELWHRAQDQAAATRRRWAGRPGARPYLAARLLVCGLCGRPMHGSATRRSGTSSRYYRCSGRFGPAAAGCALPHLPAAPLEQALLDLVQPLAAALTPAQQAAFLRHLVAQAVAFPDGRLAVTPVS